MARAIYLQLPLLGVLAACGGGGSGGGSDGFGLANNINDTLTGLSSGFSAADEPTTGSVQPTPKPTDAPPPSNNNPDPITVQPVDPPSDDAFPLLTEVLFADDVADDLKLIEFPSQYGSEVQVVPLSADSYTIEDPDFRDTVVTTDQAYNPALPIRLFGAAEGPYTLSEIRAGQLDTRFPGQDYAVWGNWLLADEVDEAGNFLTLQDAGVFFGGVYTTALEERPTTGSAAYFGFSTAVERLDPVEDGYAFNLLTGTTVAEADFGASTMSVDVALQDTAGADWGTMSSGPMAIDAQGIYLNTESNLATSSNGHQGAFVGSFFGPDAQETAGLYLMINETTGSEVQGSFGGARIDSGDIPTQ